MDFITQNMLGAAAAQAAFTKRLGRSAFLIGALGGAVPDFDFLLKHFADPALPWQYHRHFTHALVFIPIGGLIAAAPFLPWKMFRGKWKTVYGAATLGCATHGVLDASTSFGTHLLWPFVSQRVAWDWVSIIDPIAELPLWLFVILALILKRGWPGLLGLLWLTAYVGLGAVQHARGVAVQERLAAMRGHELEHSRVMPGLATNRLWRSVYRLDGEIYADAIALPWFDEPRVLRGGAPVDVITLANFDPGEREPERVRMVFEELHDFANGYTARHPLLPGIVGDMRYSMTAAEFDPIWGIEIVERSSRANDDPKSVYWRWFRGGRDDAFDQLINDFLNPGAGYTPLSEIRQDQSP